MTENFEHDNFESYYQDFSLPLLKQYMKALFSTLDFIHSKGIIHRDIKPHNILFNTAAKTMKIIDFGLAEFYYPDQAMSPRVASRYFKAPELLLEMDFYNYSVDIWAVGIIFASIVTLLDF